MLKTLKILCVLLKVFMLMRTALTSSSKDQENCITQDNPSFRFIDVHEYVSSNIESVQYYFENDNAREINKVGETTPSSESIPSEPTFPRAFVEFNDRLNQKDIFVTFRWNEPKFTNGVIHKYTVQYWFIENQMIQRRVVIISNITILQHKAYNLKLDTVYYFKVQAHNKFGAGSYTKFINVSTTHENPVPLLLVHNMRRSYVLDIDLQIGFQRNICKMCYKIVYSELEHKIYGITSTSKLITLEFNPNVIETNQNYTIIAKIKKKAYILCIDWIGGSLYWLEDTIDGTYIMKLDLILLQQKGIKTYEKIALNTQSRFLTVLPYKRHLYWKEDSIIVQTDFNGRNKVYMKDNECFCVNTFLGLPNIYFFSMTIDTTNIDEPLIYWLINYKYLIVTDINGCNCNIILSVSDQLISIVYLSVDSTNIYLFTTGHRYIYILKKRNALLESKENIFECLQKIQFTDNIYGYINHIALDKTLQSYPPEKCLISTKNYRVEEMSITANSIKVNLPEPNPNDECKKYNLNFIYNISVSYLKCLDNDLNKFEEFDVQTDERQYKFQNLTQFTEYTFKLALSNFYVYKISMDLQFGPDVKLITTGKLHAPDDVVVQVVMPNLAVIDWMPPKNLNCVTVNYEVKLVGYLNSTRENQNFRIIKHNNLKHTTNDKFFAVIRSLIPKQKYEIYVSVYPIIRTDVVTDSVIKAIYLSETNNLSLNEVGTNSMNISWIPSVNLTIPTEFFILEYKNVASQKWRSEIANNIEGNNDKITYYVENLKPKTPYKFRLKLKYTEYREDFIWPSDGEEFIFETLGDTKKIAGATGTATQYYLPLISCLIVIIVIYNVYYFYCIYRRRKESNEIVSPPIMMNTELVALNEIPFGCTQLNLLDSSRLQYNQDEFALTIIKKNQIIQTKFLGNGAFGNVYQGIVKDFEGLDTTPVAIKKLKTQVSSKEKKEFLKEAKLMSHFRHENVLRILGISLDTDSPLLILELIEPGDLLTYLRNDETWQLSDSCALRLKDLLAMCEDVARGCCYLERQQFVHRDLACRNCLISVKNYKNRIVKIGDFGLARDIYKDHYYRMEEKRMLPIRWMAPESLVFGIFTSQSDVWAFGVLH